MCQNDEKSAYTAKRGNEGAASLFCRRKPNKRTEAGKEMYGERGSVRNYLFIRRFRERAASQ